MESALEYLQERALYLSESLDNTRYKIQRTNSTLASLRNSESNLIQEIESINNVLIKLGENPRVKLIEG